MSWRPRTLAARVLLLVPLLGACARGAAQPVVHFERVAPGILTARTEVPGTPPFQAVAFDVDLSQVEVRLARAAPAGSLATVDAMTTGAGDVLAVNASFFDVDGKAMGRASDRRGVYSAERRSSWGALVIDDKNEARIVLGDALAREPRAGDVVVQGVPRLVVGGSVMKLKEQTAARTAVCAAGRTLTIVVTTEADTGALATFLARPRERGGLGCKDALNLDGGPSTQLVARLGAFRVAIPGGSGVPNALVFSPRPPPPADAGGAAPTPATPTVSGP